MADTSPPPGAAAEAERRARLLLGIGAAVGLAWGAFGLLAGGDTGGELPAGVVAAVNGEIVRLDDYQRAVQAFATDRRDPVSDADRRHVLDRLIDEELLVQRGLELGLARHDRRVRGDLVSAVIAAVVQQSEEQEPDDAAVEAFYRDHREYFARTGRLFVRQVLVRGRPTRGEEEARARAADAVARLRGGAPFEAVDAELGDPQVAPLPEGPLPAAKLREYLGPTATRAALELAPGGVSDPVRSASGFHVLLLVDREDGHVPELDEIREEVRAELRRRGGDQALRAYLDELRDRADLRVARDLP
jgi:parvulin-like peptidyl-prolyl isomerase